MSYMHIIRVLHDIVLHEVWCLFNFGVECYSLQHECINKYNACIHSRIHDYILVITLVYTTFDCYVDFVGLIGQVQSTT